MNTISSISKLAFFKAEKYNYDNNYTVDTSSRPRPHFCMGLILSGSAEFFDCCENAKISLKAGDIIFVPISSRYKALWQGNPDVTYISMHFSFDYPSVFSRKGSFMLQKIECDDFKAFKNSFETVLNYYKDSDETMLLALSEFYSVLAKILPELKKNHAHPTDIRINSAIEYIEQNYAKNISIETLSGVSNMSVSRFFPAFKNAFGITPIDYLNNYRINRAIIHLMNDDKISIEAVSEKCGFDSSAYFRRVFKKITGKSPREYRKSAMEI